MVSPSDVRIRREGGARIRITGRPRELALQKAVVDVLRRLADPAWRWTHFPAGEARDGRTGAKLQRMGLARGWADLLLVSPAGVLHSLELKRAGEDLTDEQAEWRRWAIAHGIPHHVARSLDEALLIFDAWGCLRRRAIAT